MYGKTFRDTIFGMKRKSAMIISTPAKRAKTSTVSRAPYKQSTVAAPTKRRVELKRVVGTVFNSAPSNSGTVFPFPGIEAGDGEFQRDGRSVEVRGYQCLTTYTPLNVSDTEHVRFIVFLWKSLPTLPTTSDIIDSGPLGDTFLGTYVINTQGSYEILSDRIYNCNPMATSNSTNTTFARATAAFQNKGSKKYSTNYWGSLDDIQQADGAQLFCLAIPRVGGGGLRTTGSITFIDI